MSERMAIEISGRETNYLGRLEAINKTFLKPFRHYS